jgi:hypothetical protein
MAARQPVVGQRVVIAGLAGSAAGLALALLPSYTDVRINALASVVVGFGILLATLVHVVLRIRYDGVVRGVHFEHSTPRPARANMLGRSVSSSGNLRSDSAA